MPLPPEVRIRATRSYQLLWLLLLVLLSPAWGSNVAHAQQPIDNCSYDVPCPTTPELSVDIVNPPGTVQISALTVYFTVNGIIHDNQPTVSLTLNGVAVSGMTYQFEPGGHSVNGTGQVTLAPGVNTIVATYCGGQGCQSATSYTTYNAPPPPPARGAPLVTAELNSQYRRSFLGCAACADASFTYSTPAYRSLDQDRGLTFVYSSAMSAPRGLVVVDVNPNSSDLPAVISLSLKKPNGLMVDLTTGGQRVFYNAGQGVNRVTAQFDASGYASGAYTFTAVVRNWWADSTMQESQFPVRVIIVNGFNSPYGRGMSTPGLAALSLPNGVGGDAMILKNGRATVFTTCGSGCWTAPPGDASTLTVVSPTRIRHHYRDGSDEEFDSNTGLLAFTIDRFGTATNYYYDAYGRLVHITDPAWLATTISWSGVPGSAMVGTITTPGGRISQMITDGSGRVTRIVDPDSRDAITATYNGYRVATTTDRLGATTDYAYDVHGGLASVMSAPMQTVDRGYARSTTTFTSRQAALLPGAGLGAPGGTPGARVFADGGWFASRSQRGDSLRVMVNGAGDATAVVTRNPQGKLESTTIAYNIADQPLSVVATNGTRMEYEWIGSELRVVNNPVAQVALGYTYDGFGQVATISVDGVERVRNFYSADARAVLDSSRTGTSVTRLTYDSYGRPLTIRDPSQHQTTFTYQGGSWRNLASVTKNGVTQFAYDGLGRPSVLTDAAQRTFSTEYDALNRVTRAVAPDNSASQWSYDDATRTYGFTDAKLQHYGSTLNLLGLPVTSTHPVGGSDSYGYDSDGNLASSTSRAGRTVSVTHDILGRVTQTNAGGVITNIAYDTASKWVAYSNSESIDTVFVDGTGRVAQQVTVRNGVRMSLIASFGPQGERQTLVASSPIWGASRQLSFGVDNVGRPNFVGDVANRGTSIAYNADNQVSEVTLPVGPTNDRLKLMLGYDGYDRLSSVEIPWGLWEFNQYYQYDELGRTHWARRGVIDHWTDRRTFRDLQGRVNYYQDIQRTQQSVWMCDDPDYDYTCYYHDVPVDTELRTDSYSYDAVGNRTDHSAVVTAGNRVTYFDGFTLTHDTDGYLTSKVGNGVNQTFTWNSLGQLTTVTDNNTGGTTTFGYDGLGRRSRQTVNGVATYYLYDGVNIVMQMNGSLQPVREFSYYPGVDHPHAMRVSATGAMYYYVSAAPNSVAAVVDGNGQVVNRYSYTPFGQMIAAGTSETVPQPFRFTGREFDASTGLYYYRARYYDPALSRFISEDPIGLAGGVNQYAYVENDPVDVTDPSGLDGCVVFSDGGKVCRVYGLDAMHSSPDEDYDYSDPRAPHPGSRGGSGGLAGLGPVRGGAKTGNSGSPNDDSSPSCSTDAVVQNAKDGAIAFGIVGAVYGATVGAAAGYAGGTAIGTGVGGVLGAPTVIGAPIAAFAGGLGGGITGGFAGGWVGAHAGLYAGAFFGAVGGVVEKLVLCSINR